MTTVRMLSWTQHPIETVYCAWELSRHNNEVKLPSELAQLSQADAELHRKIHKTFDEVLASEIPVSENVTFLFEIADMSIALREQLVRHRIGHHYGDRLGCDIVPDLSDSTWWSQSMRILPMDEFATRGAYDVPESIRTKPCSCPHTRLFGIRTVDDRWLHVTEFKNPMQLIFSFPKYALQGASAWSESDARQFFEQHLLKLNSAAETNGADSRIHVIPLPEEENRRRVRESCQCNKKIRVRNHGESVEVTVEDFYREQMGWIQSAYNRLVRAGVPLEDARNLIPLGATHRLTWSTNLAALQHVVGKRGCWILQLGVWEPVIRGIIEELASKISPAFRQLIKPPCIDKAGQYSDCKFHLDNARRVQGEDEIPPCSLWAAKTASCNLPYPDPKNRWSPVTIKINGIDTKKYRSLDHAGMQRQAEMEAAYSKLWGRDIHTGALLPETYA